MLFTTLFGLGLSGAMFAAGARAQEVAAPPATPPAAADSAETPAPPAAETTPSEGQLEDQVRQTTEAASKRVGEIARRVDADPKAQEISAGILQPIYQAAEYLSFPMFHWAAFALMATGVVSYALQLVLGKLALLARLAFSPSEILSDTLGLVISAVGLVLTTQAAAENSTFTQSPAAVLSASAVGVVLGFIFYRWGQHQELQAAAGRTKSTPPAKA